MGKANHIYFFSFGKGTLVGYLGECQSCKVHTSLDPQIYQIIRNTLPPDLTDLIQETFPSLEQYYQHRLEIENCIERSPRSLPADIRATLIEEPFYLLSPLVESRLSSGIRFDWGSSLGCLFTFMASILFFLMLGDSSPGQVTDWLGMSFLILILSGVVYTIVQLSQSHRKYLNRAVVPLLAKSLKPLQPSLDELEACLKKMATQKLRIGRQLKAKRLLRVIELTAP